MSLFSIRPAGYCTPPKIVAALVAAALSACAGSGPEDAGSDRGTAVPFVTGDEAGAFAILSCDEIAAEKKAISHALQSMASDEAGSPTSMALRRRDSELQRLKQDKNCPASPPP